VECKVSAGDLRLTGEKSEFLLAKFAISKNTIGTFDLKLSIPTIKGMYTDERYLRLHVFTEDAWHKHGKKSLCNEKVNFAKDALPIVFDLSKERGEQIWAASVNAKLDSSAFSSAKYWYMTLDDCSLEVSYHSEKDVPAIHFEYVVKDGESHFSADESGMDKLHSVQVVVSLVLFLWIVMNVVSSFRRRQSQIHVALLAVASAILCDILSCISELIHSTWYSIDGIGSYTFDALASHFEAQCDAIIALLLIFIGSGWTLPTDIVGGGINGSGKNNTVHNLVSGMRSPALAFQQLKKGNPAALLTMVIMALHAVLAQWGRTFDDDFDAYHSLEHLSGKALLWFRFSLAFIFLLAVNSVKSSGRCPQSLQSFLFRFSMVGVSWFIALPFMSMFVSSSLHYHQRHYAQSAGSALVQTCSLVSLVWLFTADSSSSGYHRLSKVQVENNDSLSSGALTTWKFGKAKLRFD
jgi:hypothetical protein